MNKTPFDFTTPRPIGSRIKQVRSSDSADLTDHCSTCDPFGSLCHHGEEAHQRRCQDTRELHKVSVGAPGHDMSVCHWDGIGALSELWGFRPGQALSLTARPVHEEDFTWQVVAEW